MSLVSPFFWNTVYNVLFELSLNAMPLYLSISNVKLQMGVVFGQ